MIECIFMLSLSIALVPVNCFEEKPNFVIFYIENINEILPELQSPSLNDELKNLHRLKEQSIVFHNNYGEASSASTFAAMFTGKPAVDVGIIRGKLLPFDNFPSLASSGGLSTDEITVAKVLKEQGYQTWFSGYWKMGLGPNGENYPTKHGFDTWMGVAYPHNEWCEQQKSDSNPETLLNHPYMKLFYRTSFLWLLLFLFLTMLAWFKFISGYLYMNLLIYTVSTVLAFYILLHLFVVQKSASCVLYYHKFVLQQPYDMSNVTLHFTQHSAKLIDIVSGAGPFFMVLNYLKMLPPHTYSSYFDQATTIPLYRSRKNSLTELDWSIGFILDKLEEHDVYGNTMVILTGGNTCSGKVKEQSYQAYQQKDSANYEQVKADINWLDCFKVPLWIKDVDEDLLHQKTKVPIDNFVRISSLFYTIIEAATGILRRQQSALPQTTPTIYKSLLDQFQQSTCPVRQQEPLFNEIISTEAIETFIGNNPLELDNFRKNVIEFGNDSASRLFVTDLHTPKSRGPPIEEEKILYHYYNVQRPVMITYKEEFQIIYYYLDAYKSLQKLDQPIILDLRNSLKMHQNETEISTRLGLIIKDVTRLLKTHMLKRQSLNLWSSQFEMPVYPWLLPCVNFPHCRTQYVPEADDFSYLFKK